MNCVKAINLNREQLRRFAKINKFVSKLDKVRKFNNVIIPAKEKAYQKLLLGNRLINRTIIMLVAKLLYNFDFYIRVFPAFRKSAAYVSLIKYLFSII